jgi:hypothetical protein
MANGSQVRLWYIDVERSERVRQKFRNDVDRVRDLIEREPGKLLQRRNSSIGRAYEESALLSYALGLPLTEAREQLRLAVEAYEVVIQLRGTDPAFPVTVVKLDSSFPIGDLRHSHVEPAKTSGEKDFSVGNSCRCYHFVALALIVGQTDAARRLAAQIWDPPECTYINYSKYSCGTVNQQRLAYVLRKFYEGDFSGALDLVRKIGPTRGETKDIVHEASIWSGLLEGNERQFLDSMYELLSWHERKAKQEPSYKTEYFVCTHGLGLAALAVGHGLTKVEQLPQDNAFFPLDLVEWHE